MAKKTEISKPLNNYDSILSAFVELLEQSRRLTARSVNALMTATYWEIGRRIVEVEQKGAERADYYGKEIVDRLAKDLTDKFGRGFGRSNLFQMRSFYLAYEKIVQTLSGQSQEIRQASSTESFILADIGQMLLYTGYADKHWREAGENPPVGLILCDQKNDALAHYTLENLPNKVLASEYKMVLPDEKILVEEIRQAKQLLSARLT